jgi:hypothetical protein
VLPFVIDGCGNVLAHPVKIARGGRLPVDTGESQPLEFARGRQSGRVILRPPISCAIQRSAR